jgi:hypothetical protein
MRRGPVLIEKGESVMRYARIIGYIFVLCILAGVSVAAQEPGTPDQQQAAVGQAPPRLSFVDGQVSFWRSGAQDWTQAQLNTPLAPGDELYTGSPGNLELQIGARAFVRTWANTQIGLENQEPDFLQFKVTTGYASFDLRTLEPGRTVEVDTPNAAFTIDHPGYYRIDVSEERTSFIARRGGQATVTPASGASLAIAPSEEVVIEGIASPKVTSYTAPELDEWDKWNYARTDQLLDAVSARYVSPDIYGTGDLDPYGTWRIVPAYGPVWVPTGVAPGWVPYSTGSWILDPFYGWTWVGTEPWGWAPYHYGRWVFVNGFWGWAPGPVVARPAYAPALVAFFGGPNVAAGIAVSGGPLVGWVALGWGEPLVPWWGPKGFIHRPWWGGWGGPRVVNNVVIKKTTVVQVQNIKVYRNISVNNALVAVDENHFGRGRISSVRIAEVNTKNFRPIHAAPLLKATPAAFEPDANRGPRPAERNLKRSIVATRPPHASAGQVLAREPNIPQAGISGPPHLVGAPKRREPGVALQRPPFGRSTIERPMGDRAQRSVPPMLEEPQRAERLSKTGPSVIRPIPSQPRSEPQVTGPSPEAGRSSAGRPQELNPQKRWYPGEPANNISPYGPRGGRFQR